MNRIILILGLAICFCSLSAQKQITFDGGLEIGGVTSQVAGDSYAGYFKMGVTGSAFVEMGFSDNLGAKLAMGFTQKGAGNKPDTLNLNYYRLRLNYIDIPLSVVFKLKEGDIAIETGAYYSYLLSQKNDFGSGYFDVQEPQYNQADIGGHVGITYLFSDHVGIHARFSQSLVPMRDKPENTAVRIGWDGGGYNSAIHLAMHILF